MNKILKAFKKTIVFTLCLIICSAFFVGCTKDNPPKNEGYINERDKYFFGVGEMFSGPIDQGQTPEIMTSLVGEMGFKMFRLWMHSTSIIERSKSGQLTVNEKNVQTFKGYIKMLEDAGIERILAMSHQYLYPVGFPLKNDWKGAFPDPESPYYELFMNDVEETWYLLASAFPEIKYWEAGNEINHDEYCHKPGYMSATNKGPFVFTLEEKARIATDLMYFANKGIKRANPENICVMPGLVFDSSPTVGIVPYVKLVYENIKSGNYPSIGETQSKDNEDYFQVLNWHPYNWSGNSSDSSLLIMLSRSVYDVAIQYGDEGKKVYFSEFGYTTTEKNGATREENENRQKDFIKTDYQSIYEKLPFVESVIIFRMFDCEDAALIMGVPSTIETGFGLFRSPLTETGIEPKGIGLSAFHYINGDDADPTPLYKFSKSNLS